MDWTEVEKRRDAHRNQEWKQGIYELLSRVFIRQFTRVEHSVDF